MRSEGSNTCSWLVALSAVQLTIEDTMSLWQVHSVFKCQVFCNGYKSCFLYCLHYRLPCTREGACSCLVGGPLAQQVKHTVFWSVTITCPNGLYDLVFHIQEGTKVSPVCIQLLVKSFNNVCSQRRERQDVVLCGHWAVKHTAVLSQAHRQ